MTGKKTDAIRKAIIAFLDELGGRKDVPDDLRLKALELTIQCKESGRKGVGSQLPLREQMNLYLYVKEYIEYGGDTLSQAAERATKHYPLGQRRIEQIYHAFKKIEASPKTAPSK